MSFVNLVVREINCKIVYYGPGLSGKTTNLRWIFEHRTAKKGDRMISLSTEYDRTLFFDFLPVDLGTFRDFRVRLHLYTVPGQVLHEPSRGLLLRGVDGVVLVADSQKDRMKANLEALESLQDNLRAQGYDFAELPYLLQLNKRDLPTALLVEKLKSLLVRKEEPVIEAVASKGVGVYETLRDIGRLVLAQLKQQ